MIVRPWSFHFVQNRSTRQGRRGGCGWRGLPGGRRPPQAPTSSAARGRSLSGGRLAHELAERAADPALGVELAALAGQTIEES
jgi:hypothetical protein